MKISLRVWIFLSYFLMGLLNGGLAWLILKKMDINSPAGFAGPFLLFLAGTVIFGGLLALLLSILFKRSYQSFVQAAQTLSQNDLPRLSAALGALSDGDLSIQIQPQAKPMQKSQHPWFGPLIEVYNKLVQEIEIIYRRFNDVTDEPCRRMVYVGADSYQEGRTCGEIMGKVLQGSGKVAIVSGLTGQGLELRATGFMALLQEKYMGIQVVASIEGGGISENTVPKVTLLFQKHPDLAGIYITDGNTPTVLAKALTVLGKAKKVKLVCHDLVDGTMQALQQGIVTSTISQDPFAQGHDPVIYLYNYLVSGQLPPQPKMITQMDRITIDNYAQYWDPLRGAIESAATQERRARPLQQMPNRPLRIIVLGREDITFFDPVRQGALAAAEELKSCDTRVEWVEPESARQNRNYGAAEYGPAIEAYMAMKYDGIVVPVYDKALVPFINRAIDAGIPVATYNSEPSSLRGLLDHLNFQAQQLRNISLDLAQSAAVSGEQASQINESIGAMTQALSLEVQAAVEAIDNTAQIAAAIKNISLGAQEQSRAANSVSEAVKNISEAVGSTNQTALNSEKTAEQAMEIAQEGANTIKMTLDQIEKTSTAVKASVNQIHALNELSKQINSIVSTINDFAEQTNLLALNAAIEAAHAGDTGSGFAVVAAEIRSLAEKSRRSTKEISALIRDVQHNSVEMVATVDSAMNQAQAGGQLANQAGHALDELLKAAGTMKDQTEKVVLANASVIQSLGSLNDANEQVSEVIEENASATEQVTINIQQTVQMVEHMTGISKKNSTSIDDIHSRSDEVAERAQRLKNSIASLASMAEDLQGAVAAFKINHHEGE